MSTSQKEEGKAVVILEIANYVRVERAAAGQAFQRGGVSG